MAGRLPAVWTRWRTMASSVRRLRTDSRRPFHSSTANPDTSSPRDPGTQFEVDHLVVGAGVVGLAVAARLASRGGSTLVVDKNSSAGQETSSRNSEVIHAGIYYPPNSLKTKLCIRGNELLYDTCEKYGIEHRQLSKWVVAQTDADLEYLEGLSLKAQGLLLPTPRMKDPPTFMLTHRQMSSIEPHVHGLAALVSPRTGIVDVHGLMQFLEMRIVENNGDAVYHCNVIDIEQLSGDVGVHPPEKTTDQHQPEGSRCGGGPFKVRMETPEGVMSVKAATVVNCAGLHSDKIYAMLSRSSSNENGSLPLSEVKVHYCKGHYYGYSGPSLVSRLIYPVPDKNLAGLGTHLTLDLSGRMRFGPDILYVDQHDDYSLDPETVGSASSIKAVSKVIQTYLRKVDPALLYLDYAGIRPKLAGPGEPFRDFLIRKEGGFVHLGGIESPGLTSALAIAEHVEELLY